MKFEFDIPSSVSDSVVVAALRTEAEVVWHSINYYRKQENPSEYEIEDFWNNYKLLGAMYLVEEYLTANPIIRKEYPRDEEPEEWMAWDD